MTRQYKRHAFRKLFSQTIEGQKLTFSKRIEEMKVDSDALAAFFNEQREVLIATAAKFIKPFADDCVQEAGLNAIEKFGNFQGSTKPQLVCWLRKIVINQCLSRLRRKESGNVPLSNFDKADSRVDSPSLDVRREEELTKLNDGLANLNERQRDAVTYRFLLGLTVMETADVMGESKGSIQGLIFRGVQMLGKILTESQFSVILKK